MSHKFSNADLQDAYKRGYLASYRWLRHKEAARDACQEAMMRAMAASTKFDTTRPFYPWFYRILRNLCMDRLNSQSRAHQVSAELQSRGETLMNSPEDGALTNASERQLVRAIESLDDDLREAIELRHFQDLSYESMAEIVGCPIGTVMSRLYRARKALRHALSAREDSGAGIES